MSSAPTTEGSVIRPLKPLERAASTTFTNPCGSTPLERPNESGHSPIDVILRVLHRIELVDASPAKLTVNIEIEVVGQLFIGLNHNVLLFVEEVERVQDCPNSRTMFLGFNPRLLNSPFDILFLELSPCPSASPILVSTVYSWLSV